MSDQPQTFDQQLLFNGINAETGEPVTQITPRQAAAIARGDHPAFTQPHTIDHDIANRASRTQDDLGFDGDPRDLAKAGWGIIFSLSRQKRHAIKEALTPLLAHRQQMTQHLYQELTYKRGETKDNFLQRHGAGTGQADPEHGLPYYLLIVADPRDISYEFQYQLDVQYAVGRLWFGEDDLDAYARYAQAVVDAETGGLAARHATFFGVNNPGDAATRTSKEKLLIPLANKMQTRMQETGIAWDFQTLLDEQTRKQNLAELLKGGTHTPGFLFTASHGLEFLPNDEQLLLRNQGALVCQDWNGSSGKIGEDVYFAAHDLESSANLQGLMAFLFACYGAGTPETDEYAFIETQQPLAPYPFIAPLPQKMLRQGALAVIGHVGRAWSASFEGEYADTQLNTFETTIKYMLSGYPVGSATEWFNVRYAELATVLASDLQQERFKAMLSKGYKESTTAHIASLWIAHNDARSYILLGDPAVRLVVDEDNRRRFIEGDTAVEVGASRPEWKTNVQTVQDWNKLVQPPASTTDGKPRKREITASVQGQPADTDPRRKLSLTIDTAYPLTITPDLPTDQHGMLLVKSSFVSLVSREEDTPSQGDSEWRVFVLPISRQENNIHLTITPHDSGSGTIDVLLIDSDFAHHERTIHISTAMNREQQDT